MTVDRQWVERQLLDAGVDPAVEQAVVALVEVLADADLAEAQADEAARLFAELARGRHIAPDRVDGRGMWRPATPGRVRPGDRVRVRMDAFDSTIGDLHNGREGVVVEVGGGDVIVRTTDDREPALMAHYSPHVLEVWGPTTG
jgi:hypothetical protein